jgi:mannose-6-phosphate isomerase
LGGSQLPVFRNDAPGADDHIPEDLLASISRVRNGDNQRHADEGVSRVMVDGRVDLFAAQPQWFWGQQTPAVDESGQIGVSPSGPRKFRSIILS